MDQRERSIRTFYLALAGGAALWIVTAAATGQREAWDAPQYWLFAYPLCIAFAAWLGHRHPVRAWRWGVAAVMIQAPVAVVTSDSSWNLLPLGIVLFLLLSLPAAAAAEFAARMQLRRNA